jgi:Peptidoglycan-binding protein, CsiV
MSRRSLLGLAALLVALSSADTLPQLAPATPTGPPLYQVEVLVFAYRDFDPSEERFAQDALPRRPNEARRPVPVFDESTLERLEPSPGARGETPPPLGAVEPGAVDALGFRILRPEELQLTAEYRKLERVPTYLPLGHGGWVQPGLPEDQSQPFDLAQLGVLNPAGSIHVYLSRFLHVTVDVSYRDTLHGPPAAAAGGLAEVDIAPRYDLVAERQTRSGELQYFDHPAFGVLVKVTPVAGPPRGTRPAA